MNKTYKLFADKMGGTQTQNFIGTPGEIFYDPDVGALRISDGVTVGGLPLPATIISHPTVYDEDIIPVFDNTYTIGSSTLRWKSIYIGPGTLYIQDQNNAGLNCALTVLDGVLQINGANQLQVGQLRFVDNAIQSTTPDIDISIGLTSSTGSLLLNRNTTFENSKDVKLGNLQLLDSSDNILAQLTNDDSIGKLLFGGGSNGIWMDSGKFYVDSLGYSTANSALQTVRYNSVTHEVSYGPANYSEIVGVPELPNYATDTAANVAIPVRRKGMLYYNTTAEKVHVWTGSAWHGMN